MTPVRVVYRKYDGSLHWHMELGRLGADEYGTWRGAPADSQSQRGSEEPVTFSHTYVLLIPWFGGWTMTCNAESCWTELYIDITTVPQWVAGDQVKMVDLDLDVVRGFDGSAQILDEDEFAEHQVRYGYPPEVTGHAERAAAAMLAAVTSGTEPFGQVCRKLASHGARSLTRTTPPSRPEPDPASPRQERSDARGSYARRGPAGGSPASRG